MYCIKESPFGKIGTFAQRPTDAPYGFQYYCSDKNVQNLLQAEQVMAF